MKEIVLVHPKEEGKLSFLRYFLSSPTRFLVREKDPSMARDRHSHFHSSSGYETSKSGFKTFNLQLGTFASYSHSH